MRPEEEGNAHWASVVIFVVGAVCSAAPVTIEAFIPHAIGGWQWALSFAALGSLLTLMIDLWWRVIKPLPVFLKEAPDFSDRLDKSAQLTIRAMRHALAAGKRNHPELLKTTNEFLERTSSLLEDLSDGVFKADLASLDHLRDAAAVDSCLKTYESVSRIDVSNYWALDKGKTLFLANQRARARGVDIERIFVVSSTTREDTKETLDLHKSIGVKVRCVDIRDVVPLMRRDFGIIDEGSMAVEQKFDSDHATQIRTEFIYPCTEKSNSMVDELKKAMKHLHNISTPY
ncbi:MAG TPA: hypothetical protein VII56_14410 [Rhizomicrobium sp.]